MGNIRTWLTGCGVAASDDGRAGPRRSHARGTGRSNPPMRPTSAQATRLACVLAQTCPVARGGRFVGSVSRPAPRACRRLGPALPSQMSSDIRADLTELAKQSSRCAPRFGPAASRSADSRIRQRSRRSDGARLFCARGLERHGGEVDRQTSRTQAGAGRAPAGSAAFDRPCPRGGGDEACGRVGSPGAHASPVGLGRDGDVVSCA
jgi:hypothetical protein